MWRSLVFVSVALSVAMAATDLTVKTITRSQDSGASGEGAKATSLAVRQESLFVHGQNLRSESLDSLEPGLRDFSFGRPGLVIIDRCEEGLEFLVNPVTHQYIRRKTAKASRTRTRRPRRGIRNKSQVTASPDAPTYTSLTSETEDTGEQREMFGLTARHFITRTSRTPTGGLSPREDVVEGWFVEGLTMPRGCRVQDKSRIAQSAAADPDPGVGKRLGLPVQVKYTAKFESSSRDGGSGQNTHVFEREIVELSEKPVDAQLFEVPKGYKRVKHFRREPRSAAAAIE